MSAGAGTSSKGPSGPSSSDRPATKVEIPGNQSLPEKVASPVATLSSSVDPWPHYIMSGACAGAGAYSYTRMNNPRVAAIAGGFSLAYLFAGRLLVQGHERLGYDIGTVTSLGLVATALPAARATGDTYSVTMAALGGVSSLANVLKSYQMRTGKPHEMQEVRR